jgi:hypothetical protein
MLAIRTLKTISLALMTVLLGISPAFAHGKGMYASKAEAQKRAQEIGCSTSHQNNGRWMPCSDERELHKQLRKH